MTQQVNQELIPLMCFPISSAENRSVKKNTFFENGAGDRPLARETRKQYRESVNGLHLGFGLKGFQFGKGPGWKVKIGNARRYINKLLKNIQNQKFLMSRTIGHILEYC